jgi:hypothetical protein
MARIIGRFRNDASLFLIKTWYFVLLAENFNEVQLFTTFTA